MKNEPENLEVMTICFSNKLKKIIVQFTFFEMLSSFLNK